MCGLDVKSEGVSNPPKLEIKGFRGYFMYAAFPASEGLRSGSAYQYWHNWAVF